jgi:hypothetical protein
VIVTTTGSEALTSVRTVNAGSAPIAPCAKAGGGSADRVRVCASSSARCTVSAQEAVGSSILMQ